MRTRLTVRYCTLTTLHRSLDTMAQPLLPLTPLHNH